MPHRLVTLAVVIFWLGTSSWLFYRDLWPKLRPGEPPPYTIDLVDEARLHAVPTRWSVFRDGKKIGKAHTSVRYSEADDTFELHSVMKVELYRNLVVTINIHEAKSMYRVSRDGELREVVADIVAGAEERLTSQSYSFKAHFRGEVQGRRFKSEGWVNWPGGKKELTAEPVEISASGAVLNPLHPVNRILGLSPGQQWRIPLVDPLRDTLNSILPGISGGPRFLEATVAAEPQDLDWDKRTVPCLVIEYKGGDNVTGRTWVRQSDGLVLRQEARQGELLILQREP